MLGNNRRLTKLLKGDLCDYPADMITMEAEVLQKSNKSQ
jgi:hypothetical protein